MTKRVLKGSVVSDSSKRDKTIAVTVLNRVMHQKYKKYVTVRKKYHAHDEKNLCKVGDIVEICECRPYSKTKCWVVVEKNRS